MEELRVGDIVVLQNLACRSELDGRVAQIRAFVNGCWAADVDGLANPVTLAARNFRLAGQPSRDRELADFITAKLRQSRLVCELTSVPHAHPPTDALERAYRLHVFPPATVVALRAARRDLRNLFMEMRDVVEYWLRHEKRVLSIKSALRAAQEFGFDGYMVKGKCWAMQELNLEGDKEDRGINTALRYAPDVEHDDEILKVWGAGGNHEIDVVGNDYIGGYTALSLLNENWALSWALITLGANVNFVYPGEELRTLAHTWASVPFRTKRPWTNADTRPRSAYDCAIHLGMLSAAGADFNLRDSKGATVARKIAETDIIDMSFSAMVFYARDFFQTIASSEDVRGQIKNFHRQFKTAFSCSHHREYRFEDVSCGGSQYLCAVCGALVT